MKIKLYTADFFTEESYLLYLKRMTAYLKQLPPSPSKEQTLNNIVNIICNNYQFNDCRELINILFDYDIPSNSSIMFPFFIQNGNVKIGNNTKIYENVTFNSDIISNKSKGITIGNNCLISSNVKFVTNYHNINPNYRFNISDGIIINDNVWIGIGAIILPGVIVGKNSIIGAGSVVTKNVPENEIWAGNPAKLIRKII